MKNWLKDDPLENFIKFLKGENEYDQKIVNEINNKIMIEIDSAFKFAKNDKFPNPASIKSLFMPKIKRLLSASEAILEASDQMMKKDNKLILIGEGINDPKGIFGTTSNLFKKYGKDRVIESPISENGITGVSIGLSINGFKVLLIHQRVEFALLSLEQIINNAAKSFYVSNGKHNVPIVIRMVIGRGWGQGPAHSQSLETIFSGTPGLKVIIPSTPYDAKGMLISSIFDPNPVLILEHRWFHFVKGEVPKRIYKTNLKKPNIILKGGMI